MNAVFKNKSLQYAFVVFTTLASIHLWSFQGIPDIVYEALGALAMAGCAAIILWHSNVFNRKTVRFKTNVLLLTFLPLLSAFGAYIYHHQALHLSITRLRPHFFWLLYFVLHAFKIEKKKVIKLLIFVGCVWAFLTIVQQFTYPRAYFFTRGDADGSGADDSSIYRAGVYRFMIAGLQYGIFVLLYYFYKYLTTKSNKKINFTPFIGFALLGIYFYGTRQIFLSVAVCMGMAVLYLKPAQRVRYIALGIPLVLLLWGLKHVLFSQYAELTNQQMQYGYSQDVRVLSAKFWLFDYWPHWTAKLIGNGPPHILSPYGKENELILAYFHFYRSDVGIIGAFNEYGIFYVLAICWVIIKVLRTNALKYEDKYLKLFLFNSLVLLIINEDFSKGGVFLCFVFYLIDKAVEEYKQARLVVQEDLYAAPELGYT